MPWSKREGLIPNYNANDFDENYISQNFEKIKQNAIQLYNLEGLSDIEIEEALFKMFIMQEESFETDLDKVILFSYINNFQKTIQADIEKITLETSSSTSLQANQNLFAIRNKASKNNRQLVFNTFNKYFSYLVDGQLVNKITNTNIKSDSLLPHIAQSMADLFVVPSKLNPQIAAPHLEVQYNYDRNYWLSYFKTLELKRQELLLYFQTNDKLDELKDFEQIANLYYSYATYYKLNSQRKRKTL